MNDIALIVDIIEGAKREIMYAIEKLDEAAPGTGTDTYKLHELIGSAKSFSSSALHLLEELTKELVHPE